MTIHHTIVKKAAADGFVLIQDGDTFVAHHPATNTRVAYTYGHAALEGVDEDSPNDAAKAAWADAGEIRDWKAENPESEWAITQADDESFHAKRGDDEYFAETWLDLLDLINDAPEAEEDGEEEAEDRSSVVPDHYKKLYREIGVNGQDNGDWLAREMHILVTATDGKKVWTVPEKVELLALANGIEYAMVEGSRGWQGRYRMTISNMLRKKVADTGFLHVPGSINDGKPEDRTAPQDFCDKYRSKPKKKAGKVKEA